jgi:hypothetical protein
MQAARTKVATNRWQRAEAREEIGMGIRTHSTMDLHCRKDSSVSVIVNAAPQNFIEPAFARLLRETDSQQQMRLKTI